MRSVTKFLFATACVVAFAASADAQGRRGGAGGGAGGQPPGGGRGGQGMTPQLTQLVTNKGVIEELKITDEQKETLAKWSRDAGTKQREKMQELFGGGGDRPDPAKMREMMAGVAKEQMEEVSKVLKEEQTKRLKQIMLQLQGVNAFSTKDVQDGLKLTDEQKDTIKEIVAAMLTEQREMMAGAFGGGGGERPDPAKMQEMMAEMNKKRAELSKKYMEKVSAQLKDDQKKSWTEMTGKAFDYKPEAPMRRRDM